MTLRTARHLAALLLVYLAATVANSATVTVGDVPPAVDATAPAADLSALLSSAVAERDGGGDLDAPPVLVADAQLDEGGGSASPLLLQSGTGKDTRLSVDLSAIDAKAEQEGWPTWKKIGVVSVCVAVGALVAWVVYDSTHDGSSSSHSDNSTHYNVNTDGTGNTSTVVVNSPCYGPLAPALDATE